MANRDHSLDEPIIKAAKEEFMNFGYTKASMRNIATRAGITTGALYTRYKSKSILFNSLVKDAFSNINQNNKEIENLYNAAFNKKDSNLFIEALKKEERLYVDILFKHYDECYLVFVKGEGSDLLNEINKAYSYKTMQTIDYFTKGKTLKYDKDGIELIMNTQFNIYKEILNRGYSKEKAVSVLSVFEEFMLPSWKRLFEEMM